MKNTLKIIAISAIGLCSLNLSAQNNVGIGTVTPDNTAILDLKSSNQGMLVPRMTTSERLAIVNPAEALLVYDTNVECFFYFKSGSSWQNMCSSSSTTGPAGPAGPTGATGPAGTPGIAGAQGPAGINGIDGVNGAAGATGPAGPAGSPGIAGAQGPAGVNGIDGVNGAAGATGPAGPAGSPGIAGAQGPAGVNGIDGVNGVAGATGPAGAQGPAGAVGATGPQGPSGIINKFHVMGTASRANVTSTTHTLQPGLSQVITLTAASTIFVSSTLGALNVNSTSGQYSHVEFVLYVDGAFLPSGGWNRFTVVNPTGGNGFATTSLNTMFTLAAGTHTIEIRTARLSGSTAVTIGGNAAIDTNAGELTIMILN